MKIQFLGAVGTVTGSKYAVSTEQSELLVDCGLYQGVKQLRLRNRKPLPIEPSRFDAVVLTHAHIDHSGYLPALVRDGFHGPIYCTRPTFELCQILLLDSAKLHEEDAAYANRKGFSKHRPALPLYTQADAEIALRRFEVVDFFENLQVGDLTVKFQPAGHILGAASIHVSHGSRRLLFSGDLGRSNDLLMNAPEPPGNPDWIVIESTYGNRLHGTKDPIAELASIVSKTVSRGGTLLIPSFAVGRAQTLLYCLHQVFEQGLAPKTPVFVNSPMATNVTALYQRFAKHHRLSAELCHNVCDVATFVQSVDESKKLGTNAFPKVIISASGMATGGRVLHHLKQLAPDHRNTILLPGFQAPGTRGEAIASGAKAVKIHGKHIPIEAEVIQLDIFSAHADQSELLAWLGQCDRPPRRVFITHGNEVAADTLRCIAAENLGLDTYVPEYLEEVELS